MKLIVEMLKRVWRGQANTDAYAGRTIDEGDRSSMADFVRILQTHDRDRGGSSHA